MDAPLKAEVSVPALLGAVIAAVGTNDFCTALTAWLQAVCPYSYTVIFGYHQAEPPIEIYDDFPKDRRRVFVDDYVGGPYHLDPFYLGAIGPTPAGLYRLKDLAPDRFYQGEYYRTYYMRTGIAEEIGYFASMPQDCHVVLSLMRKESVFSASNFRKLQEVAPVVTALMSHHWRGLREDFTKRGAPHTGQNAPDLDRLTPREKEIVSYILRGHSAEATGLALGISPGTVRIHRRNIYGKLKISSQQELFAQFLASHRG